MNYAMIFYVLGTVIVCVAALMAAPLAVALWFHEPVMPFLLTILLSAVIGIPLVLRKPKNKVFYLREGMVITALGWLVMSVIGAFPFMFSGSIPYYVDAFFETVSGFTTTGASILNDVEALPKGLLFWRSFTHWIGGMGVLVFLLTVLPKAGGSNTNLMKAESPGPQVEKLVPKIRDSALILYGIYILLTALEILCLKLAQMPLFDAVTHSLGTAGTGGFGIKNSSIGGYTPLQQNIITVFMIMFGVNFNFYFYLFMRKIRKATEMEEVRWYIVIIVASTLLIAWNIRNLVPNFGTAVQQAAFQVASIITTTGFSTTDFDLWPNLSRTILVVLMFVGACAGSTGGGFKVSRIILICKDFKRKMQMVLRPNRVCVTRIDKKAVNNETLDTLDGYLASYIIIFVASVLLVSFDGFDTTTTFTAVAATFNNIGPGLAKVGASQNFSIFQPFTKLILCFDMLAGRLEIFPMLIFFSRDTWRRH